MQLTEKQKAAHRLASDYTGILVNQEALVGRMIDQKWKEMEPQLEAMIERKIHECLLDLHLGNPT